MVELSRFHLHGPVKGLPILTYSTQQSREHENLHPGPEVPHVTLASTVSSMEPSEREVVQQSWTLQLPVLVLVLEADAIVGVRIS